MGSMVVQWRPTHRRLSCGANSQREQVCVVALDFETVSEAIFGESELSGESKHSSIESGKSFNFRRWAFPFLHRHGGMKGISNELHSFQHRALHLRCESSTILSIYGRNPQLKPNKPPGKQNYRKLKKQQQQSQPTVFEIERAIGAGVFRDREPNSDGEEEKAGLLDNILKNTVGRNEGDLEKKLRETGEWLINRSESTSRSAGKQILVIMFLGVMPLWMSAFLVASGIIHLPFHSPFLDSLLNS